MRHTSFLPALGLLTLGLLAALAPSPTHAGDEERTAEAMARLAFEAMQANDAARLDATVPSVKTLEALYGAMLATMSGEERARAEAKLERRGGAAGIRTKMLERIHGTVRRVRDATLKDFDLSSATFEGAKVSKVRPVVAGTNFVVGRVTFTVRSGDTSYAFESREATRINGAWDFAEGWRYVGPNTPPSKGVQRWLERKTKLETAARKARSDLRRILKNLESLAKGTDEAAWSKARDALVSTLAPLPTEGALDRMYDEGRALLADRKLNADDRGKLETELGFFPGIASDIDSATDEFHRPRMDREEVIELVRARLDAELGTLISAGGKGASEAAHAALLLRLPAAAEPLLARFDAASIGRERLWVARDLVKIAPGRAKPQLVTWAKSTERPEEERMQVYLLVFPLLERAEEGALAMEIGANAVAYLVRKQISRGDMDAARYIPHAPKERQSSFWMSVLKPLPAGIEPEAAWPLIASDDADLVVRRAKQLERLQKASVTVQFEDAPLAKAAEALAAATGLPFEALGEGRLSLEHQGTNIALPLLRALEKAKLTLRVTAATCFIGTVPAISERIEVDRRVPPFAPQLTDGPLVKRMRRELRQETSVSFFVLQKSIADCLRSTHFMPGGNTVVLPALLDRATGPAGKVLDRREVRPMGVHLRRVLDACDGGAALTSYAMIVAPVDAFPRIVFYTPVEGLAAAWAEPVDTFAASHWLSGKGRTVLDALQKLPKGLRDAVSVTKETLAGLDSKQAPYLHLASFASDEEKLTNWGFLQLMLLDSGYCSYVDKGVVTVAPVQTEEDDAKPKK